MDIHEMMVAAMMIEIIQVINERDAGLTWEDKLLRCVWADEETRSRQMKLDDLVAEMQEFVALAAAAL